MSLQAFVTGCLRVILGATRCDIKRNTTLWCLGEMDRVETMVMKRRLRWLGHIERTKNSWLPKCFRDMQACHIGRKSAEGQKKTVWCPGKWFEVVWAVEQLKEDSKLSTEEHAWRCLIREMASNFNDHSKAHEKERTDERKKKREEGTQLAADQDWKFEEPGCAFVVQTKAGLVNHVRQRHGSMVMVMEKCDSCDKVFQNQGITMHWMDMIRWTPTGRWVRQDDRRVPYITLCESRKGRACIEHTNMIFSGTCIIWSTKKWSNGLPYVLDTLMCRSFVLSSI